MYLEHYGLDQPPFRITPNTALFYAGAKRGATLEALTFAVLHEEGIVKVSGEVGSGKTMLCRMLLKQLPDSVETLYLANPTLGPDSLLRLVADELKVEVVRDNAGAMVLEIQRALIERFAQGRRVVALIDEAHAMPIAALEQIRLLSNLETGEQKLLQIVLFGQPELDEILARKAMRQLKDRITHHFRLDPMGGKDVGAYLDFRLRAAGYRGPELFSRSAVRLLARASSGLSRRINILADKALLAVYTQGKHQVQPKHVVAAIRDSEYPMPPRWGRWATAGGLVAAAGLAILLSGQFGVLQEKFAALAPLLSTPIAAPPQTAPAITGPAERPAPAAVAPTQVTPAVAKPAEPAAPRIVAGLTDPDSPVAIPTKVQAPTPAPAPAQTQAPVQPPVAIQASPAGSELAADLGPLARAHQAQTPEWVRTRTAETWFLQLHTVDGGRAADIETYLERLAPQLDATQLRIYVRDLGWGRRVGIIYGEYAKRSDALAALRALPASLREAGAYLRQVRGLQ